MQLTDEQKAVLEAVKKGYPLIKINAFAGTGKTTTLLQIAKVNKNKKILYLAFNKSIQLEAQEKFPQNVEVRTTHSLAYFNVVRNNYGNDIRNSDYKAKEIADMFHIDYDIANLTLVIFNNYCNSASKSLSLEDSNLEDKKIGEAKEFAIKLFNKMLNKEISITHNFYLKLFQLKLLELKAPTKSYDIVMLDEAQDTNDVTLSIFYNLKAKQKIIVGDKHQQIYSFRGSVNAMQKVKAKIFYLTQSFRFNSQIAKKATDFLSIYKGETKELKGINKDIKPKNIAHITRTNSTLIKVIADLIENDKFFKTIREPYAIFGLSLNILKILDDEKPDSGFKYLKLLHNEFEKQSKEDSFLKFLAQIAKETNDKELYFASKIVSAYKSKIKLFYQITREYFNKNKECRIFLTTGHTSKGLEFDEVIVYEDFDPINSIALHLVEYGIKPKINTDYLEIFLECLNNNEVEQKHIDELNLYYVAITRAIIKVEDCTTIQNLKDKKDINRAIENQIEEIISQQ